MFKPSLSPRTLPEDASWSLYFSHLPLKFAISWMQARPLFKDRRKFSLMADPTLQGHYPPRGLYQALAVAAMCVQEQPTMRPLIADVVTALTYLASQNYTPGLGGTSNPGSSRLRSPGTSSHSSRDLEKKESFSCWMLCAHLCLRVYT